MGHACDAELLPQWSSGRLVAAFLPAVEACLSRPVVGRIHAPPAPVGVVRVLWQGFWLLACRASLGRSTIFPSVSDAGVADRLNDARAEERGRTSCCCWGFVVGTFGELVCGLAVGQRWLLGQRHSLASTVSDAVAGLFCLQVGLGTVVDPSVHSSGEHKANRLGTGRHAFSTDSGLC